MSDLFTVQPVAYMDDGANQTFHATEADVRKWAAERGLALVPAEPTDEIRETFFGLTWPERTSLTPIHLGDFHRRYRAMIAAAQESASDHTP